MLFNPEKKNKICTSQTTPIVTVPYRVTVPHVQDVLDEIETMLKLVAVVPSESPWATQVMLVQKPDHIICVD